MAKTHLMRMEHSTKNIERDRVAFRYVLMGSDANDPNQSFSVEVHVYRLVDVTHQMSNGETYINVPEEQFDCKRDIVVAKDYAVAREVFTAMVMEAMKGAKMGDFI